MQSHKKIKQITTQAKSGFTLVELTLTMSFVAVLLITIAIVTTNIVTIYQKGLALKAVNSVGRSLVDEFTMAINTAPTMDSTRLCENLLKGDETAKNNCKKDQGELYNYQSYKGSPAPGETEVQYGGIFCTGRYSYVWNTYYGIKNQYTIQIKYRTSSGVVTFPTNFDNPQDEIKGRLMRIKDPDYRLCSANTNEKYESKFAPSHDNRRVTIDITKKIISKSDSDPTGLADNILSEDPETGLLSEFDLDLMLYELLFFPASKDPTTMRSFRSGTFVLATKNGNVDIRRSGDYCQPPEQDDSGSYDDSGSMFNLGSTFNYCAINKFNFAARTAGV